MKWLYKAVSWSDLCFQYTYYGKASEAEAAYSQALEISNRAHSSDNQCLTQLYMNLGVYCIKQKNLEEAEKMFQRSLTAARELSEENPEVAYALTLLGYVYCYQNRYELGETACLQSIDLCTKLFGEHAFKELSYQTLATIYEKQNRQSESEEVYLKCISAVRENYHSGSLRSADRLWELGSYFFKKLKFTSAEPLLQEATQIYQRQNHRYSNPKAASSYLHLATIYQLEGRLLDAEMLLKQTAEMSLKTSALCSAQLAAIYHRLGAVFTKQNRLNEAETILLKAVSILTEIQSDDFSEIYYSLAIVYFNQRKWAGCERYFIQNIELKERKTPGSDHTFTHFCLALVFMNQGKLVAGEAAILNGISTLYLHCTETPASEPFFYSVLAKIYKLQGRLPEAKAIFIHVINEMKLLPDVVLKDVSFMLSDIYRSEENYSESERVLVSLLDVIERRPEELQEVRAMAYLQLGFTYYKQRRYIDAEPLLCRSIEIHTLMHWERDVLVAVAYCVLGSSYTQQGHLVQGASLYQRAIEIARDLPEEHHFLAGVEMKLKRNLDAQRS